VLKMLLRVHIVAHRSALAERLARVLEPTGLAVPCAPSQGTIWDRVGAAGDLLIISRPALPEPVEETVAAI